MTMGYMFFVIFFLFVSGVISQTWPEYDFETTLPSEISPQSSLSISSDRFKNGDKSLKWEWTASQLITWDLSSKTVDLMKNAGIKIWIYLATKLPEKCLSVCVREETSEEVSCFPMSLDFVGWRAAWVAFNEFIGCPLPSTSTSNRRSTQNAFAGSKKIDQLFLKAPSSGTDGNPLYIDLLRFAQKISKASRDSIVPPLTYDNDQDQAKCISCADMSSITEEAALEQFERKAYWQHKYRWSLKAPSPEPAATVDETKLNGIKEIGDRLVNWYANESKAYTRIPYIFSAESDPFHYQRWNKLLKNFNNARTNLNHFTTAGKLVGLFARNSEYGDSNDDGEKFSELFYKVLHPLTLEYFLKSRRIEVEHTACEFATEYPCGTRRRIKNRDIKAITGVNSTAQDNFSDQIGSPLESSSSDVHPTCSGVTQACFDHVVQAIDNLNNDRKAKILELFSYIKDQGWGVGSALGSMDHELLGMSGFAHSVFLMKNELTTEHLNDIIAVMKWFMEFGEVYQTEFEFRGSTADRIRTAMFYRVMTVLIMPEENDLQKREKIRDMESLKRWIENALTINEGLADLIKPDFTSYHHRFFYATAYCPSALHTAAFVSYLLDETPFELHEDIKENLTNAFKVYRIAATHYSTPSGIGGRNPNYNQSILAEHVPAYAYLAMKSPLRRTKEGTSTPNLNVELAEVRMFLRLYEHTTGSDICNEGILNEKLCDGNIGRKYYLNTLGALEIMDRVKTLASTVTSGAREWYYEAEDSPSGHWSKQFASFSVHRRDDWVVSVKGFDKSVVDFESSLSPVGNLYGMYSSNGAMLIANSESALKTKDVDKGWDWRKIPGTTAINVSFSEMKTSSHNYNPADDAMAGGVRLNGSQISAKSNGVFGMSFKMPTYEDLETTSPFFERDFRFKKSVFFYDDIIISLGSDIIHDGGSHEVHTTLFQDLQPETPIPTDDDDENVYRCNDGDFLNKTTWEHRALVTLVDVNGNRYYIPDPDRHGLVFHRNVRQASVKNDKTTEEATNGMYCTALFNHGINPSASKTKYEYAVQVGAEPVGGQAKESLNLASTYSVLKKDAAAHVVKFLAVPNKRGTVYGYVVFSINPPSPVTLGNEGPLLSVHNQSVIMTEETTDPARLHISVSSPQLKLERIPGSPSWCPESTTTPASSDDVDETLLFCAKSAKQAIHVNLRENEKWRTIINLYVGGKHKTPDKDLYLLPTATPRENPYKFINLRNGADTEVEFSDT